MAQDNCTEAWVTLATNDSYSLGALVLARSLRRANTTKKLVVMVTPGVSQAMRTALSEVFDLTEEVNVLDSQDSANLALLSRPELGITFTKLHCWRLTQFTKCVFLDADTLVLQNCDELFQREEFSAAPDAGWPDCFNSGVFVFLPSQETYGKLLEFAVQTGSFDGGDQGLLNLYFNDWSTADINKHLPFIYNMCSSATYSYLPAFNVFGQNVKIVHFIGPTKPWLSRYDPSISSVCPPPGQEHLRDFLQTWWDIFKSDVHAKLSSEMETTYSTATEVEQAASKISDEIFFHTDQKYQSPVISEIIKDEKNPPELCSMPTRNDESGGDGVGSSERVEGPHVSQSDFEMSQQLGVPPPTFGNLNIAIQRVPPPPPPPRKLPSPDPVNISCSVISLSNFSCDQSNESSGTANSNVKAVNSPSSTPCDSKEETVKQRNQEQVTSSCGVAAAYASMPIAGEQSDQNLAHVDQMRKLAWEQGNIDYLGKDSFDNIMKKIQCSLAEASSGRAKSKSPSPPKVVKEKSPSPPKAKPQPAEPLVQKEEKKESETPQPPRPEPVDESLQKMSDKIVDSVQSAALAASQVVTDVLSSVMGAAPGTPVEADQQKPDEASGESTQPAPPAKNEVPVGAIVQPVKEPQPTGQIPEVSAAMTQVTDALAQAPAVVAQVTEALAAAPAVKQVTEALSQAPAAITQASEAVAEVPAVKQVTEALSQAPAAITQASEAVAEAPAVKQVTEALSQAPAAMTQVSEAVAEAPAVKQVTEALSQAPAAMTQVSDAVAEAPAVKQITEALSQAPAAVTQAMEALAEAPGVKQIMDVLAQAPASVTPATDAVAETPVAKQATEALAQAPAVLGETPVVATQTKEALADAPAIKQTTEAVSQIPAAMTKITEALTEAPAVKQATDTMAQAPAAMTQAAEALADVPAIKQMTEALSQAPSAAAKVTEALAEAPSVLSQLTGFLTQAAVDPSPETATPAPESSTEKSDTKTANGNTSPAAVEMPEKERKALEQKLAEQKRAAEESLQKEMEAVAAAAAQTTAQPSASTPKGEKGGDTSASPQPKVPPRKGSKAKKRKKRSKGFRWANANQAQADTIHALDDNPESQADVINEAEIDEFSHSKAHTDQREAVISLKETDSICQSNAPGKHVESNQSVVKDQIQVKLEKNLIDNRTIVKEDGNVLGDEIKIKDEKKEVKSDKNQIEKSKNGAKAVKNETRNDSDGVKSDKNRSKNNKKRGKRVKAEKNAEKYKQNLHDADRNIKVTDKNALKPDDNLVQAEKNHLDEIKSNESEMDSSEAQFDSSQSDSDTLVNGESDFPSSIIRVGVGVGVLMLAMAVLATSSWSVWMTR